MSSYDLLRDGKVVGTIDMSEEEALIIADLSNIDHIGVRQRSAGLSTGHAVQYGNIQMAHGEVPSSKFHAKIVTGDNVVEFKSSIDPVEIARQISGYEQLYEGLERRRQPHGPRTLDAAIAVAMTKDCLEEAVAYTCDWVCLNEFKPDFITSIRATTLAWNSRLGA